jgi:hypothetical protein
MLRDSERTFFVVATAAREGGPLRIVAPPPDATRIESVFMFDGSQFPACLVWVVGVQARLRTFFEFPECFPWSSLCIPNGVRTLVSHYLEEFTDPPTPRPAIVGDVEEVASGYEALWVSERAVAGAAHSFLTTGERVNYRAIDCRVQLHIEAWADLPRSSAAYDHLYRPRALPEYERRALDDFERLRSAVLERARASGPHVGSFIPCSLCYGFELWEPYCVLEIAGQSGPEGRRCVLHVLSDTASPTVRPHMQLRTRTEVRGNEVITNLGQIVG